MPGRFVFQSNVKDAVLVAVQRKQLTRSSQAEAVDRVEHGIGREVGIRWGCVHGAIVRRAA
jgi:hypothetical protein